METNIRPLTSLRGKTVRWTFEDGPLEGKTFEHSFADDGTVNWCSVSGGSCGQPHIEKQASTVALTDDVALLSYRSSQGNTLTVALNFNDMKLVAYGSNGEMWSEQRGRFKLVSG